MSEPVVVQIIITAGVVVVALIGLISALLTRRDVKAVRDQTENTHETNLRVDIDTAKADAATAATEAKLARESVQRTERYVADLAKSLRAIEHSMDRRDELQAKALGEIREDFTKHLEDTGSVVEWARTQMDSDDDQTS